MFTVRPRGIILIIFFVHIAMHTIRSIVALDLEATGIPSQERYSTKITELALVACERDHCLNEKELPRILHKLVVPLNPMKAIGYGAYRVSGEIISSSFLNSYSITINLFCRII